MKDTSKNIVLIDSNDIGVLRLTLNDPDNKNALSEFMMQKLINAITEASKDNSVKVIVIASTGNVFCSGHNLKEIKEARRAKDSGESFYLELFKTCSYLMQLIVNCSKPVIAEVSGIATAAGCQLVASCDLAVSSNSAKFATPGVNIGLFCSTPMVALSRNVAKKNAMEMLLTGDMIGSQKAKDIGLINYYVDDKDLESNVMLLANKIASKPSSTVSTGKKAFYEQAEMSLQKAYEYTSEVMRNNILREDAKEGISAFIEKRSQEWQKE